MIMFERKWIFFLKLFFLTLQDAAAVFFSAGAGNYDYNKNSVI